ncbi:MAG: response regulator [Bacteroidaceae bacterium]|nr:response regulator [Bacteroidaceae bacterium]
MKTVLVIEDNDLNRNLLAALLKGSYEVLTAKNGAVGLEVLKSRGNDIALIFLDIQMPVMDGYEFLKAVQEDGTHADIPIIVTTIDHTDEERCLSLGAIDFVGKPYDPSIIKRRADALIRMRDKIAAR